MAMAVCHLLVACTASPSLEGVAAQYTDIQRGRTGHTGEDGGRANLIGAVLRGFELSRRQTRQQLTEPADAADLGGGEGAH